MADNELVPVEVSDDAPVPNHRKLVAASLGALTTAVTMTPFDVVKTRLQTQHSPELFVPTRWPSEPTCCQPAFVRANADLLACKFDARQAPPPRLAFAGAADGACEFPNVELARERLGARYLNGFVDAFGKIVRNEGAGALWRGVGPALVMSVPSQATYMVGYDRLRAWALNPSNAPGFAIGRNGELKESYRTFAPLAAGSFSRAVVVSFFSPLELLRTRLQSVTGVSSDPASIIRSTAQVVRRDGIRSLWRGLPPTLWRDVPFSGIYWASYELVRRELSGGHGMGEGLGSTSRSETFRTAFASGAIGGIIAAAFTNPFDVIKTRRQASNPDSSRPNLSTLSLLRTIAREEGLKGLMSGLTARSAKTAIACGIMIGGPCASKRSI